MNDKGMHLASPQEIEQELSQITSPDYRMFAGGQRSQAARLLVEIHNRFDATPRDQSLLGSSNFSEWVRAFCKDRRVSGRNVWYLVKAGKFLLPRISEARFERLEHDKRNILADLAEAGRLTEEFLEASFDISITELKRRAAPLLGREAPWEEHLIIDSHWAAIAALIQLGNLLDYKTYTAHSGIQFQERKLGEIATLVDLPRFPSDEIERSAKRIDVIWVKEEWPDSFFEVENSTNVTSGLQRMYQVLKYEAKFFIVAPNEVRPRFFRAISESPYKQCRDKYLFRSYPQLNKMFRSALKYRKAHDAFFGQY